MIKRKFPARELALAVSMASVSMGASAITFDIGDEATLQIDTTLKASAAWRTEDPNLDRVAMSNSDYDGNPGEGSTYNYDDGSLNFKKGETYTKAVTMSNDIEFTYGDMGAFARIKSFYDFELQDENREHKDLSASARDDAGSDIDLLDAFVFWNTYVGEDEIPVTIRAGKQVISWGESTFIQGGINSTNPVDATAARTPGAEVKDILLPVEMLYASVGVTENLTVEAYYQLKWRETEIDPCGTFYSTIDFAANVDCGNVLLATVPGLSDSAYADAGAPSVLHQSNDEPSDSGQFGIALRYYAEELNETEFGLYYMQYHNKVPVIAGRVKEPGADWENADYGWFNIAYPEDIKLVGLSFNTTVGGLSLGGEVSYKMDVPVQYNAFDLVHGVIGLPSAAAVDIAKNQFGLEAGETGQLAGEQVNGWDEFDIVQAQLTAIRFFDQVLGASRLTLAAEVGTTYVVDLPDQNEARFGRSGAYGVGAYSYPGIGNCGDGRGQSTGSNDNPDNCTQDGYTTEMSWGYRVRGKLEYPNAFAGINLEPFFAWSHDVDGYGPEPGSQFIEDRMALNAGVNALYLNAYKLSVGATTYFDNADYNDLDDRDNVYASLSYSF
jgi:hypothetical protein